jgi:preprotein translocase subunit YajC
VSDGLWIVAQAGSSTGSLGTLLFPIIAFAVLYLLMFRPQQKQMKEHRTLMQTLKKGDEVITSGGIIGRIYAIAEGDIQLEVSSGVRLRILKSAIQSRIRTEQPAEVPAKTKEEK